MTLSAIITSQKRWARTRWPDHRGIEAPSIEQNLFQSLSSGTWDEFAAAAGDELGLSGCRPKMRSLRSSSALTCNVFDPWRGADLSTLTVALGLADDFIEFRFEQKFPHGLSTEPPNLDLVFYPAEGAPVGVESKFTEPYANYSARPPLKAKYLQRSVSRWEEVGLPRCQILAESLGTTITFRRLDAGQLLKHLLALARVHCDPKSVRLLYIWFDTGDVEAQEHREDLQRFAEALDAQVEFHRCTYQRAFEALLRVPEPKPGYLSYLRERYFAA